MNLVVIFLSLFVILSSARANTCTPQSRLKETQEFTSDLCQVLGKEKVKDLSNDPKFNQKFDEAYTEKVRVADEFIGSANAEASRLKKEEDSVKKNFNDLFAKKEYQNDQTAKADDADFERLAFHYDSSSGSGYNATYPPGTLEAHVFKSLGLTKTQIQNIKKNPSALNALNNQIRSQANILRSDITLEHTQDYKDKLSRNKASSRSKLASNCTGEGRQITLNYGMSVDYSNGHYANQFNQQGDIKLAAKRLDAWKSDEVETIGYFKTEGEAYGMLRAMSKNDNYGICGVQGNTAFSAEALGYAGPKMVRGHFGSGKVFKDNSSELSTDQDLDVKKLVSELPSDQKLKVKIYTCASMLRNCANGADNTGDCNLIDQMRNTSDENLLKTSTDPQLKKLLQNPVYQAALQKMKTSPYFTEEGAKVKEQRLWLALSTLRAMRIEATMRAQAEGKDLVFELVPTGDPNDPYNNSKIDPALSGTCGPLAPPASKDFYNGSDANRCDMKKELAAKLNKVYEDPAVKERLSADQKKLNTNSDNYGMHRYANIEVETIPADANQITSKDEKKITGYRVYCVRNNESCVQWKKEFVWPKLPRIPLPSISFGGGGGGGGPFKNVCNVYPNR